MLEGTELSYAYSPIMNSSQAAQEYDDISDLVAEVQQIAQAPTKPKRQDVRQQETRQQPGYVNTPASLPNNAITQQLAGMQKSQYSVQQQQQQPPQKPTAPQYDINMFNKQFEQEQKIATLMNEIKAQKAKQYVQANQAYQQPVYEESYWDKMTNKKKDLMRFIQSGLIVLFAISLHFVVDFLLKHYLQANDVSYNREVIIRVLYPLGILFIAWNIIAFIK